MSKHTSIEALNVHLFEAMEMLKNNNDPKASANEKMDAKTAEAFANLAGKAIEARKIQVQAMSILAKTDNPRSVSDALISNGFIDNEIRRID